MTQPVKFGKKKAIFTKNPVDKPPLRSYNDNRYQMSEAKGM